MNKNDLKVPKDPKDMVNMELLEAYSAYSAKGFRTIEEQNYLGQLRQVILERMSEKECANCGSPRSKAQKEEKENEKVITNIDKDKLYRTFLKFLLENGEYRLSNHGLCNDDIDEFIENAIDDPFFHEELEDFIKDFIRKNGEVYGMLLNPNFR